MTRTPLFALLLTLGLGGNAVAQEQAGQPVELGERMNAGDMSKYVRTALEEMLASFKSVTKLVEQASRDEDPERLQCLKSRLSYIRALMMVSERANGAMKEAQAESNPERAEHEFRKIVVASAKVRQFLAEAEACLGEAGTTPGTSELQLAELGIETEDELEAMDDYFSVIGVDPPNTSPFE